MLRFYWGLKNFSLLLAAAGFLFCSVVPLVAQDKQDKDASGKVPYLKLTTPRPSVFHATAYFTQSARLAAIVGTSWGQEIGVWGWSGSC